MKPKIPINHLEFEIFTKSFVYKVVSFNILFS